MRKIKNPKPGEYVLLTKFADKGLNDPWFLGFFCYKKQVGNTINYYAKDSSGKVCEYQSYRYCYRLTPEEGAERWNNRPRENEI